MAACSLISKNQQSFWCHRMTFSFRLFANGMSPFVAYQNMFSRFLVVFTRFLAVFSCLFFPYPFLFISALGENLLISSGCVFTVEFPLVPLCCLSAFSQHLNALLLFDIDCGPRIERVKLSDVPLHFWISSFSLLNLD